MAPRRHRSTQLDRIERLLETATTLLQAIARGEITLLKEGHVIMSELTDLQAEVTAEETVGDSLVTLVQGLAAQLAAAGTDPAALKAITDDLTAHASTWAAVVAANTPAPPAPAPAA